MKLGEFEDFFAVWNSAVEGFYISEYPLPSIDTTNNILYARRFTKREDAETFRKQVAQEHIRLEGRLPVLDLVCFRITTKQL